MLACPSFLSAVFPGNSSKEAGCVYRVQASVDRMDVSGNHSKLTRGRSSTADHQPCTHWTASRLQCETEFNVMQCSPVEVFCDAVRCDAIECDVRRCSVLGV